MAKLRALRSKAVDVWRCHLTIAVGSYAIEREIICEDKENVREFSKLSFAGEAFFTDFPASGGNGRVVSRYFFFTASSPASAAAFDAA